MVDKRQNEVYTYIVKNGEGLWEIAINHGTLVSRLERLNPNLIKLENYLTTLPKGTKVILQESVK